MRKRSFVIFSAVFLFVMGGCLIACTQKSSVLNPNEDAMQVEIIQKVSKNSTDDWDTFFNAVEELNASYFSNNYSSISYMLASDSTDDTKEMKKKIVYADIDGAIEGAGIGAAIGGAAGSIPSASAGAIVGAVIVGAYKSYNEYDTSKSQAIIATKALSTITQINDKSIGARVGMMHNILIDRLIEGNVTFQNMSYRQVINLLINQYENLFSPIDAEMESILLKDSFIPLQIPNNNVTQANQNFKLATANLSTTNLHNYTTEYLKIIDRTISNDTDKTYLSTYACQLYYSTALWEVK